MPGAGGRGENGKLVFGGTELQVCDMKMPRRWMVVTVTQQLECANATEPCASERLRESVYFLCVSYCNKKETPCWKNSPSWCLYINQITKWWFTASLHTHMVKLFNSRWHPYLHFHLLFSAALKMFFPGNRLFLSWKHHWMSEVWGEKRKWKLGYSILNSRLPSSNIWHRSSHGFELFAIE